MYQSNEVPETNSALGSGIDLEDLGEFVAFAEAISDAPETQFQEGSESTASEVPNPGNDPHGSNAVKSPSDPTIDLFTKHHLLRPRDVDALCDQRHQPGGLVAGFIGHRSLSVLVGDSGLGKSPLAYQLGICVATGIPFLGMTTKPGLVIYADYENGLEESRDLRNNFLQFLGLTNTLDNFVIWIPDCGSTFDIEAICQDHKPSLFIIDSLRAHNPQFEHKDNAGKEMSSLRSIASKSGAAILLVHHVRKPNQEGASNLEDDDTVLMIWLNQAAGHRSIVNQSDSRIATDLSRRVPDAAMVIRWHRRIHGEDGPIYIERVLNDEGDPIGYKPLTGPRLLGNWNKCPCSVACRSSSRSKRQSHLWPDR